MQRGARVRESREQDDGEYPGLKIVPTKRELAHFCFGQHTQKELLARLAPLVRQYARAGIRKPAEVARLLNRADVRTACGERWTPRLASFLLSLAFTGVAEKSITPRKPEKLDRGPPPTAARKRPPLTSVPSSFKQRPAAAPQPGSTVTFSHSRLKRTPEVVLMRASGRLVGVAVKRKQKPSA